MEKKGGHLTLPTLTLTQFPSSSPRHPNMVLMWRGGKEDGSLSQFDGSKPADIHKFIFVFESVATSGKSDGERASEFLCYLEGDAFDFFYQAFVKNRDISADGTGSQKVKKALFERFAPIESPGDVIGDAMAARLPFGDFSGSLQNADRLYEKEEFKDESQSGLLRNAVMEHLELAQFAIYRGAKNYMDLFDAIIDFWSGHCAFQAAANSLSNSRYNALESSQGMYESRGPVGSKKIMMRSNAPFSPLETKVDALTNQWDDLSLMNKKNHSRDEATAIRSLHDRTYSYCKRPGHWANRCGADPHKDTKCPRCRTFGHLETRCWARVGPQGGGSSAYAPKMTQAGAAVSGNPTGSAGNQVSVVTHDELPADEELAASVKKNADRELVVKTRKDGGGEPIPSLLTPRKYWTPNNMGKPLKPGRRARKERTSKKNAVQEPSGKYDVVSSHANAPSRLIRGDGDEDKKEIRRLFNSRPRRPVAASIGTLPKRLKVVSVQVYGTQMRALLDSGSILNVMNASVALKLSLSPKPTSMMITVSNGQKTTCLGSIQDVPVSFNGTVTSLNVIVVAGSPVDMLIGYPTLEELQACIDLDHQSVRVVLGNKTVKTSLEFDQVRLIVAGSETDSEDLTSYVESFASERSSEEEPYVVTILGDDPFELDLTLDGAMVKDDKVDSPQSNDINKALKSLREKLAHLDSDTQNVIETVMMEKSIVATSLDDPRPADVQIEYHFELKVTNPIYHSARKMGPLPNDIVREELDKMLELGIITPSMSA